jgi:hypothetical protein
MVFLGPGLDRGLLPIRLDAQAPSTSPQDVYRSACITCHGADGKGSPRSIVGFETALPDFSDCAFATGEPDPDWFAVVHEGGPIRGLDRHMPAFGQVLSADEIGLAISHIRTFCKESGWPRGELNFPRAFFTEKAYPENEAVWESALSSHENGSFSNDLIYEHRIGRRGQVELSLPLDFVNGSAGSWTGGFGDLALAYKHTLYSGLRSGRIASAGLELIVPTGDEAKSLGNSSTIFEPFAMWGQTLPKNGFLQMHGGAELPSDTSSGTREFYLRTSVGTTYAQNRGFGRAWSPQLEVLWARPSGESSEWDLVPQIQVTLSKMQHVMIATGVRIPLTQREERPTQVLTYLLWDWFDGGFREFWK